MIHYHGLPITPTTAAARAITSGHAFISFRRSEQLTLALEVCQSFAVDNGAFSAWKSGEPVTNWQGFYAWVDAVSRFPNFDFAVIPDVIDGDEAANDALLQQWPWKENAPWLGAPVWHLHESLQRLERLAQCWPRICLGSSGDFAQVGTPAWWKRMAEAMEILCDDQGRPRTKIHGLRMLNPEIFTRFPFSSADSTNIAQNIGIDSAWKGTYTPPTKEARAAVMRERIESCQAAPIWRRDAPLIQEDLLSRSLSALPAAQIS